MIKSGSLRIPVAVAAVLLALGLMVLAGPARSADASVRPTDRGLSALKIKAEKKPPASDVRHHSSSQVMAATTSGSSGPQWLEGSISENIYNINCPSQIFGNPYAENETGEYVGYYGNSDATSPKVGDIYYAHIVVAVLGNNCGGTYVHPEVKLPPHTQLAVSQNAPIYCFYVPPGGGSAQQLQDCSQNPPEGLRGSGWYSLGAWAAPQGAFIEVQFPVVSTATLKGISAPCDCLAGAVETNNGWDAPPLGWNYSGPPSPGPWQGVFVAANPPTIDYPSPSTTNVTYTTAHTTGYLYNHYAAGNAYFDIGTTTSYGTTTQPFQISNTNNGYSLYADFNGLSPGTTYHWRLRFVTSDGKTYTGADQTLTTRSSQPTSLSLSANPLTLTYGHTTTLSGKLTDSSGNPLSGKQVLIQKKPAGATSFSALTNGTLTTASDGSLSLPGVKPTKNTAYRVRFAGDPQHGLDPSTSAVAQVNVRVVVTESLSATSVQLGKSLNISGAVKPSHTGSVKLAIKRGTTLLATKSVSLSSSKYSYTYKPPSTGSYSVVAKFAKDVDHLGNVSPARKFKVGG